VQPIYALAAFDKADKTHKLASFQVPLVNNGNTPTKSLTLYIRCALSIDALPEPWILLYQEKVMQMPILIGPKATVTTHCTFAADDLIKYATANSMDI
jgi:hypothetical protein